MKKPEKPTVIKCKPRQAARLRALERERAQIAEAIEDCVLAHDAAMLSLKQKAVAGRQRRLELVTAICAELGIDIEKETWRYDPDSMSFRRVANALRHG